MGDENLDDDFGQTGAVVAVAAAGGLNVDSDVDVGPAGVWASHGLRKGDPQRAQLLYPELEMFFSKFLLENVQNPKK